MRDKQTTKNSETQCLGGGKQNDVVAAVELFEPRAFYKTSKINRINTYKIKRSISNWHGK